MPNRTATFVSAVFASVLAGISLNTASYGATPAADECLSAPKGPAPQGSHWYYRVERGTKRHCWYLHELTEKVSQGVPSSVASPAKPTTPKAEPAIRGSVANARAELPTVQTRDAANTSAVPEPQPPAPGPTGQAVNPPAVSDASTPPPVIASRWPDPSGAAPSAAPEQAAADDTDADLQPAVPAAAPPPVALAAADAPVEKPQPRSGSIPMLSIVMITALALAGLIGSAIVRFGGRRRRGRIGVAMDRDAMWDAIASEPRSPLPKPNAAARVPRRPGFTLPRELQAPRELPMAQPTPQHRDDGITEMLARLARSAVR
jgi:hypothetical protein